MQTPPIASEQMLAAILATAAQLGPIPADLQQRYAAGDPLATRQMQERGGRIVPGVRLQDACDLASWAAYGTPAELRGYVVRLYAENRVSADYLPSQSGLCWCMTWRQLGNAGDCPDCRWNAATRDKPLQRSMF